LFYLFFFAIKLEGAPCR